MEAEKRFVVFLLLRAHKHFDMVYCKVSQTCFYTSGLRPLKTTKILLSLTNANKMTSLTNLGDSTLFLIPYYKLHLSKK